MAEGYERTGILTMQVSLITSLAIASQVAIAKPPDAIIESCLLGYGTSADITVSTSIGGHSFTVEDVPGFKLMIPSDMPGMRVGYATSKKGKNDYILADGYRGFILKAVPLTKWKPERIDNPSLASYGIVKQHNRRYVCAVESEGQGTFAFVRAGYIGELSSAKGQTIQLYYTVADTKKFKAFKSG